MQIVKYNIELNQCKHPQMVQEKAFEYKNRNLNEPGRIVEMLNECFRMNHLAEEYLYMIAFNNKMIPLGVFEVAHGISDACYATPREIFLRALLCGATNIVIVHNHPSGFVNPSSEDYAVCHRIGSAGNLIGVKLMDFIIVGDQHFSFMENNVPLF